MAAYMPTPEELAAEEEARRAYMANVAGAMTPAVTPYPPPPAFVGPPAPSPVMSAAPGPQMSSMAQAPEQNMSMVPKGPTEYTPEQVKTFLEANRQKAPMPRPSGGGGGTPPSPWMDVLMPQARQLHNQSLGQMKEAIGMREALGQRTAEEDAMMAGKNEAFLDDASQRFAQQKEQQAQQARLVEEKYANAVDSLDHEELDNKRWWNNKSLGGKISLTLGALLGGLGSGLSSAGARTYTGNTGLDIVQGEMMADLQAQKDAYNRKKDKASGLQTLYGQMMRRFGDEDQALNAAMALGTRKLGAQVQKLAALRGTEDAQARAKEMLAKLGEQEVQFIQQSFKLRPMGGPPKDKLLEKLKEQQLLGMGTLQLEALKKQMGLGDYGKPSKEGKQDARDLARDMTAAKIPRSITELSATMKAIENAGGDLGGRTGRYMYEASPLIYKQVYGDKAYDAQQAVSGVQQAIKHEQLGANQSPSELEGFRQMAQTNDTRGMMNFLNSMLAKEQGAADAILSGYDDSTGSEFLKRSKLPIRGLDVPSAKKDE